MGIYRQLDTEGGRLEERSRPFGPLRVPPTHHQTKVTICSKTITWNGTNREEIESIFQRVVVMPRCHDRILFRWPVEPFLA